MASEDRIQVQVACPEGDSAEKIALDLVDDGLAACVQILPVRSFYKWDGRINDDREVLLLIKTVSGRYPLIERRILSLHPYDVPEIISFGIDNGSSKYLDWIDNAAGSEKN